MELLYGCCCGIDVHKDKLSVCLLRTGGKKHERIQIREFDTTTKSLLNMTDWLLDEKCEMVAMESTGPYWKPVFNILEDASVPAIVVNAAHIKKVPGRKTDTSDAQWIAELTQHGLVNASFIPDRAHRDLRDVLTYRRKMVETRAAEVNRIQKIFEAANIKLGSFINDVICKSGLGLLEELLENGAPTEQRICELRAAKKIAPNLRSKPDELAEAMNGKLSEAQKIVLRQILEHVKHLGAAIAKMENLAEDLANTDEKSGANLLTTMPGIDRQSAQTIVGIIGTDMSRFPDADHLAAWAGVAPGNNQTGGKRKRCRTRQGNQLLKTTLVCCANSAVKAKDTFYYAKFRSLVPRLGKKKAIIAVAHSMIKAIWHMLRTGEAFTDLGADYHCH